MVINYLPPFDVSSLVSDATVLQSIITSPACSGGDSLILEPRFKDASEERNDWATLARL